MSLELDALPSHRFPDVNDLGCVELVRDLRPDLTVSFGTGLIRRQLLELPGLKVNVHRGILPAYRGLDSDLWASYYRDFGRIGTTVHELDEHFDTGSVIGERRLQIAPGMRCARASLSHHRARGRHRRGDPRCAVDRAAR